MTRITELFGISYPIIQGGMIWCSGWELASAVSNAGGLGLIGSGSMDPETLLLHIRKCKANTLKPFGVNLPLIYKHVDDHIRHIIDEKVGIVFTSAGNPAKYTSIFKSHGIKVVHVVANVKFARKCMDAGVDAIVVEGFEAGGHNGADEITTFCLVTQVCKAVNLPVIAAGGIATGAGMLAAFTLGAEGVQLGTRFAASLESSAHPAFKQAIISAGDGDTRLALRKLIPVRLIKNAFYERISKAENRGADREELLNILGNKRAQLGMFQGDLSEGELEAGQIAGMIDSVKPAAEIERDMMLDYKQSMKRVSDFSFDF